ncbi:MAG TPA: hypothetical protein VLA00_07485 [Xanthobacteraceae bacterium]|nr:hypothetical protein [Xanthobacteraceae bacterium]
MPFTNLEARARAICLADLAGAGLSDKQVSEAVDRFWHVVALELAQGASDPDMPTVPPDIQRLAVEYRELVGHFA